MMQCFFQRKYPAVSCRVVLLDGSDRMVEASGNDKGLVLLDKVIAGLQLTAKEFFSLKYMDKYQQWHWINLRKSVYPQLKNSYVERRGVSLGGQGFRVHLGLKFYPRDPCSIPDEQTRYQMFLQVRQDIVDGRLALNDELLILLGGLVLQSDCGDYVAHKLGAGYVRQCLPLANLAPEMEERIHKSHLQFQGRQPSSAEFLFLDKVKWLDNYGMITYPVKDDNGNYCLLGLTPTGIILERPNRKSSNFFWPRIAGFSARRNQVTIRVKDSKKEIMHSFETGTKEMCQQLWKLCCEHHQFFKFNQDSLSAEVSVARRNSERGSYSEYSMTGYRSDATSVEYNSMPDSAPVTPTSRLSEASAPPYVPRKCVSDIEGDQSYKSRSKRLDARYSGLQTPLSNASSSALPSDATYDHGDVRSSGEFLFNQRRRKKRTRSSSPTKNRPPQELLEHITFQPIETMGLTEEEIRDIPFTQIETRADLFRVRYSPRMKHRGRSIAKPRIPPTEIVPQCSGPVDSASVLSDRSARGGHTSTNTSLVSAAPPSARGGHTSTNTSLVSAAPPSARSENTRPSVPPDYTRRLETSQVAHLQRVQRRPQPSSGASNTSSPAHSMASRASRPSHASEYRDRRTLDFNREVPASTASQRNSGNPHPDAMRTPAYRGPPITGSNPQGNTFRPISGGAHAVRPMTTSSPVKTGPSSPGLHNNSYHWALQNQSVQTPSKTRAGLPPALQQRLQLAYPRPTPLSHMHVAPGQSVRPSRPYVRPNPTRSTQHQSSGQAFVRHRVTTMI